MFSLALACGCAARPGPPPGSATAPPPSEESEPDPSQARTFGWLGIALGTEGAVAAIATSAAILDYKSTRDSGCNADKQCSSDALNANNNISGMIGWNAGAYVLAVAGLGVGTYLLLTHPPRHARRFSLTLAPEGTMGGVGLGGSF